MKSYESSLLARAEKQLSVEARAIGGGLDQTDARLNILEAAAAIVGGWSLTRYQARFLGEACAPRHLNSSGAEVLREIQRTPIPIPLALAALSREVLAAADQRRSGAYYTDWRLAIHLADRSTRDAARTGPWIDPASGSGTLLVAAAMTVPTGAERDAVLAELLVASDLSASAIRGARLSLASLTSDLEVVQHLNARLLVQDSLRSSGVWPSVAPLGGALVIANPPWEKLRITKHEAAKADGIERKYGSDHARAVDVSAPRAQLLRYVEEVLAATRLQGAGEHDLYKLFLELGMGLLADGGVLAMLLPAGLIRSQGTEGLRNELESRSADLVVDVIENRARHFAIDTRFKFLSIKATMGEPSKALLLSVADRQGVLPESAVEIDRALLRQVRPDFSIPEVPSPAAWNLFHRLSVSGRPIGDPKSEWQAWYLREVDMTNDRDRFKKAPASTSHIPVLEGRHISQFRYRSKAYLRGEGRAAVWQPLQLSQAAHPSAQWFIATDQLRPGTRERVSHSRIAFCDITGQTNERSLLTARVPADVVCGNKVPTIEFGSGGTDREDLFLALANSLVVDWMMRRLVTTTVNFFLLDSLPLPPVAPASPVGQEIIALVRKISAAEGDANADLAKVGDQRARIDALVAASWGVSLAEMRLVLEDFPLLDRNQPCLVGEDRSTVTPDAVLSALARINGDQDMWLGRLADASRIGAIPYVPAEFAKGTEWRRPVGVPHSLSFTRR